MTAVCCGFVTVFVLIFLQQLAQIHWHSLILSAVGWLSADKFIPGISEGSLIAFGVLYQAPLEEV